MAVFRTPVYPSEYCYNGLIWKKTRIVWLPGGEKVDNMFSRFDRLPACDRRKDGRTSRDSIVRAMHSIAP